MSERVKILFLSANPFTTARLRVDEEAREIALRLEASPASDAFEFIQCPAIRSGDLQSRLMKHKPHIVHFSGHGTLAKGILLDSPSGRSKKMGVRILVDLFRHYNDHVRMVFLNACLSEQHAMGLKAVVDYSIGASTPIGDRAAIAFAGAFYSALGHGRSIQQAFESAKTELQMRSFPRSRGFKLFAHDGTGDTTSLDPQGAYALIRKKPALTLTLRHQPDKSTNDEKPSLSRAVFDGAAVPSQPNRPIPRIENELFPPLGFLVQPPGRFVGHENSLIKVKKLLTSAAAKEMESNLVVVRGWPGVGKTAFAGVLGRDPEVLQEFPDGVLWTVLQQSPELLTKVAEWGRVLGTDNLWMAPSLDDAVVKLAALLRDRRMLLVIDDIWNPAHAVPFLKAAMGSCCALLATTRLPKVAEALTSDESRIHVLPVLSETDSLRLLRSIAPAAIDEHSKQCAALVRDCGYLPLSLHVAGRLVKVEAKMGLSVADLIDRLGNSPILLKEPAPLYRVEGTTLPTIEELLQRSTGSLKQSTRTYFAALTSLAYQTTFDSETMKVIWQTDDPLPVIRELVANGLLEPLGDGHFHTHELLASHARSGPESRIASEIEKARNLAY
ncbi:MAG TPA: NB-ARC domain-containing protein [Pyrinomonadaceae bacterium]|nr:NB-ARC domain-containing protein [Pyrinomonadaceae bacterium]